MCLFILELNGSIGHKLSKGKSNFIKSSFQLGHLVFNKLRWCKEVYLLIHIAPDKKQNHNVDFHTIYNAHDEAIHIRCLIVAILDNKCKTIFSEKETKNKARKLPDTCLSTCFNKPQYTSKP